MIAATKAIRLECIPSLQLPKVTPAETKAEPEADGSGSWKCGVSTRSTGCLPENWARLRGPPEGGTSTLGRRVFLYKEGPSMWLFILVGFNIVIMWNGYFFVVVFIITEHTMSLSLFNSEFFGTYERFVKGVYMFSFCRHSEHLTELCAYIWK